MAQRWVLPGRTSSYLIVWWYDPSARERARRVPVSMELLEDWVTSRRPTVQEMYGALKGAQALVATGRQGAPKTAQLKEYLFEAFRDGKLIILSKGSAASAKEPSASRGTAQKKQGASGMLSAGPNQVPFTVYLPQAGSFRSGTKVVHTFRKIGSQEFVELACMQAFGLKDKEEVKKLRLKIENFEGHPNSAELNKGSVYMEFDASVYEEGVLSKSGIDTERAKVQFAVRRKKYNARSKGERDVIDTRVDNEFKKRTNHRFVKSKTQATTRVWESIRDDLLREEEVAANGLIQDAARQNGSITKRVFPATAAGNRETFRLGIVVWDKAPPLQLRFSPTTVGNNVVGNLAFNTPVQVMEKLPGDWLQVSTPALGVGYVAASYVWFAPQHPIFEAGVRLHRVGKYERMTGKGTAIVIAKEHFDVKLGQGLPFYVALLALVNGMPIPQTMDGWTELKFQAGRFIWIPSREFADSMRGKLPSGSCTYEVLNFLGLSEMVVEIQDALRRMAQILADLAEAIWLSGPYIIDALARHVKEALVKIFESLLILAAFSVLFLTACTAIGAWFGAGGPGAAAGFKIGTVLLDWMGLGFLIAWAVESIGRIGSAFVKFLGFVWNAEGDKRKLDRAARELAEVLGMSAGALVEVLVMWASTKGVSAALKALKGSHLERAFGEGRLSKWLKDAVGTYNKAKPEIKIKEQEIFKIKIKERDIHVKTPAQTLNWITANQLARDLGVPEGLKKMLLRAPNPREALVRAWKRGLAQELKIPESIAENMLQSTNPARAIFEIRARNLAQELSISEAQAEVLLRAAERALRSKFEKGNPLNRARLKARGSTAEWQRFTSNLDAVFKQRLLKFRQTLDLSMDTRYSGQEGQIFESEIEAGVCLKRWFKKALHKMPESIRLLEEASADIQSDPKLRELIEVVKIHERGEDWVLRDFEFDSVPLSKAMGGAEVASTRNLLVEELKTKERVDGTLSKALGDILKKLGDPPSANIHWSPKKNKCIVIDMQ